MTFKELSETRYSVRSYTNEAVSKQQVDYIMECARLAPSAVNFQPWHFYVVSGDEKRLAMQDCYSREWFKTAPMYVVCCIRKDEAWVRKSDGKPHGDIDIAIAAEHICLAAAEQGLGSCWVCNFDVEMCRSVLSLPENEEPAVIIPIGHIAPDSAVAPKQRKALDEIVTTL